MTRKNMDSAYLLANLMKHMPDAIYFKDRKSHFIMVNKACADRHGWPSTESVRGHSDFDVFSSAHAEQAYADEQRIIETGEPLFGIEEKETWPDGRVTWVSTTKMPLRDRSGAIIGTFGISRDITRHKEALERARQAAREMREITTEMENDFQMAGELQRTFFPSTYPAFPGCTEVGCIEFLHSFKASEEVGGDYCAIHRISDEEAGLFVCDVQGIGVRSALGTALIRGVVQEIAPLRLDPGAYLSRINEQLVPLLCHGQVLLGVTACYLVVNVRTGALRYASAGHPLPLRIRSEENTEWLFNDCNPCGPALAEHTGVTYETAEGTVEPGDRVVLYTDGLIHVKNPVDEPYGMDRLLSSAQKHAAQPLPALFEGLEKDARTFASSSHFNDDVCLAGFHLHELLEARGG